MASDISRKPVPMVVRALAVVVRALDDADRHDCVHVLFDGLVDYLGVERAASLWDATCCRLWQLNEEEGNEEETDIDLDARYTLAPTREEAPRRDAPLP